MGYNIYDIVSLQGNAKGADGKTVKMDIRDASELSDFRVDTLVIDLREAPETSDFKIGSMKMDMGGAYNARQADAWAERQAKQGDLMAYDPDYSKERPVLDEEVSGLNTGYVIFSGSGQKDKIDLTEDMNFEVIGLDGEKQSFSLREVMYEWGVVSLKQPEIDFREMLAFSDLSAQQAEAEKARMEDAKEKIKEDLPLTEGLARVNDEISKLSERSSVVATEENRELAREVAQNTPNPSLGR